MFHCFISFISEVNFVKMTKIKKRLLNDLNIWNIYFYVLKSLLKSVFINNLHIKYVIVLSNLIKKFSIKFLMIVDDLNCLYQ